MNSNDPARLELRRVSKSFPGVRANDDISFAVQPGEIHALLGENGAGKSTLVKMIYGVMRPDEGQILLDGKPVHIASPKAARAMGIGMVFQHFSLFEAMTVLENIALGMDEPMPYAALEERVIGLMRLYDLQLDPHRVVSTLSVGERQRIEIVRALLLEPRLLIMDEPTSVLTPQEAEHLFDTLRQLAARGCSILYISHKLHEVQALCESATVLRGGRVVGTCDPRRESRRSIAEMMLGGAFEAVERRAGAQFGTERLTVAGLSLPAGGPFGVALDNISFRVRAGEIFGIAGIAGNGQNELSLALAGEQPVASAAVIRLDGAPVGTAGPTARREKGLCSVPEERLGHGAVPGFSLSDNTILTARQRRRMVDWGLLRFSAARRFADQIISAFDVRTHGAKASAASLSGGNLQKFIMGREIMQAPGVLVVAQPTWGVDAGAAAAIHRALLELAEQGSAVVVISQDLDELLDIADTLAVMQGGRLSPPMPVAEASVERIGALMGGASADIVAGPSPVPPAPPAAPAPSAPAGVERAA